MVKRNPHMAKLSGGYLFPEIARRKKALLEKNPSAKVISLGIGDTTLPLTPYICSALLDAAKKLGTKEGYSGYGDEQGMTALREKIAKVLYHGSADSDEVFISDGAKPDLGRMQILFGADATLAVQDPSYPVYVDGSVIVGATGPYNQKKQQYASIIYMRCTPKNRFFPDLAAQPRTDLIYFCSPNNPTGAVATKQQLKKLVDFAKQNRSIIIFDAAYAEYIEEKGLPKSIYEIPGAKEVAIEVNSFSKTIGFTGVRLGWCVVPKQLVYEDGSSVHKDWNRITTTIFNGASNLVQRGGLAALDAEGLTEMKQTVDYYKENARIIKTALDALGFETYGGRNAPYIWVRIKGKKSWDAWSELLEQKHIVTTPGAGFGPGGEGFLRFSSFGRREDVLLAVERLKRDKL
ncbi:LL-diaminopimelate aminotransferase [Candidatus Woesearchaeota archaeon]|nr:LL-diaminopimelate aminotransferase [Candidatus Woesearchaeota archaeon]